MPSDGAGPDLIRARRLIQNAESRHNGPSGGRAGACRSAPRRSREIAARLRAGRPGCMIARAATRGTDVTEKRATGSDAQGPALLAGGNPQIPKGYGDAPVQAYIAAMPGWKRDVGCRIDALVTRVVPEVQKAVKWNSPFYGVEGQGWFLSFHCFAKYVKVAFFRGTALTPVPPVASRQKEVRYLHIREAEPIDETRLADWIGQASRLPGERM